MPELPNLKDWQTNLRLEVSSKEILHSKIELKAMSNEHILLFGKVYNSHLYYILNIIVWKELIYDTENSCSFNEFKQNLTNLALSVFENTNFQTKSFF